jgi:hypothetical protein
MNIIKDWFTSRNGIDFSLTKLLATVAAVVMIVKFVQADVPDYNGFGLGIGMMIAALAAKYAVESK